MYGIWSGLRSLHANLFSNASQVRDMLLHVTIHIPLRRVLIQKKEESFKGIIEL
jgi:hypothetical protein